MNVWSIEVLKFENTVWTVMVVIEKGNILKRESGKKRGNRVAGWAGQNRR